MAGSLRTGIWRIGTVEVPLPEYMTPGAAGMDLCAAIAEPLDVAPGARVLVPTGLGIAVPTGFEGQIRPRSGLAWRSGLTVINSPGTIDSDYRGEVRVALVQLGAEPVALSPSEAGHAAAFWLSSSAESHVRLGAGRAPRQEAPLRSSGRSQARCSS